MIGTYRITQWDQILEHMRSGKSITSMQAFRLYGVTRLADRIRDGRARGHVINGRWLKLPSGKRCMQYSL